MLPRAAAGTGWRNATSGAISSPCSVTCRSGAASLPSNQALNSTWLAGHLAARQAEQLAEAHVVLPEPLALVGVERPHQRLVHLPSRVGDHRQRPQHQLGVEGGVGGAGGVGAGRLGQLALDSSRAAAAPCASTSSASARRAEEDRLLDLRRAREPLEGPVARAGREHRAGVGERFERPDQQRPLPVEQPDRALAVDPARHRAPRREVVLLGVPLSLH